MPGIRLERRRVVTPRISHGVTVAVFLGYNRYGGDDNGPYIGPRYLLAVEGVHDCLDGGDSDTQCHQYQHDRYQQAADGLEFAVSVRMVFVGFAKRYAHKIEYHEIG